MVGKRWNSHTVDALLASASLFTSILLPPYFRFHLTSALLPPYFRFLLRIRFHWFSEKSCGEFVAHFSFLLSSPLFFPPFLFVSSAFLYHTFSYIFSLYSSLSHSLPLTRSLPLSLSLLCHLLPATDWLLHGPQSKSNLYNNHIRLEWKRFPLWKAGLLGCGQFGVRPQTSRFVGVRPNFCHVAGLSRARHSPRDPHNSHRPHDVTSGGNIRLKSSKVRRHGWLSSSAIGRGSGPCLKCSRDFLRSLIGAEDSDIFLFYSNCPKNSQMVKRQASPFT